MDMDGHSDGATAGDRPDVSAMDRGSRAGGAGTLLLTGGTGALGRVLIREVIQESEARILTVVRRSPGTDPEERLRVTLRDEGVADEVGRRIGVIGGNLGIGDFGLLPEQLDGLRGEVESFLHLAALTDLGASREDLFRVNVEGTRRALKLAWGSPPSWPPGAVRLLQHSLCGRQPAAVAGSRGRGLSSPRLGQLLRGKQVRC